MPIEIADNGVMRALGAMDGFTGYVTTDKYIGAYIGALHGHLSGLFDDDMDAFARTGPDLFGHMYENGQIGVPAGRLWNHTLTGRGSKRTASITFKASKVPVPVDPILLEPGPSGKTVKEGIHVFVWKAPITEYRLTVTISPKRGDFLAFVQNGKIAFSSGTIRMVPGRTAGGSFTAALGAFYAGRAQRAVKRIDSQYLKGGDMPNSAFTRTSMKKFNLSAQEFSQGQQRARTAMGRKTGNYIAQAMAREAMKGGEIYDG